MRWLSPVIIVMMLALSAVEPIVVKWGLGSQPAPLALFLMRSVFCGCLSLPFCLHSRKVWAAGKAGLGGWITFFYLLTYLAMYYALTMVSAVWVVTFVAMTPVLVATLDICLGRVRAARGFWWGLAAAVLGVLITVDAKQVFDSQVTWVGLGLCGVVAVSAGLYRLCLERITQAVPPMAVSSFLFLANGVLTAPFLVGQYQNTSWRMGLFLAAVAVAANYCFVFAVRELGATRLSVVVLLQRPLAVVAAFVVLKEPFRWDQVLGIVLVLLGVYAARVEKV